MVHHDVFGDFQPIRLGGFDARNSVDEEQDLWTVADCASYDPATEKWTELPPMPEPRSSFDATAIGDMIYVVGGWKMQGDKDAEWLDSAYSLDLSASEPQWRALPQAPFQRRALSVGYQQNKLYAIGGMQPDGKVSLAVATFDPATNQWGEGPSLSGEAMEGFGSACCHAQGRLYVSTSSGKLLRLNADGSAWESVGQLSAGRFFHRLLPAGNGRLIAIGGASMQTGKFKSVEGIAIP